MLIQPPKMCQISKHFPKICWNNVFYIRFPLNILRNLVTRTGEQEIKFGLYLVDIMDNLGEELT